MLQKGLPWDSGRLVLLEGLQYELLSVQTDSTERSGIESDGLERTRVTIDWCCACTTDAQNGLGYEPTNGSFAREREQNLRLSVHRAEQSLITILQ